MIGLFRYLVALTILTAAFLDLLAGCGDKVSSGQNENDNQNNNALVHCGNGSVEGLEECDDGERNSDSQADACRTDCTTARCGDEVVDTDEQCDEGASNSDSVPDACRTDCMLARCGDWVVDVASGERCDDGNEISGDGCSADCMSLETCGNGYLDQATGEGCDNGEANSDAPDAACRTSCQPLRCGDSIIDEQHQETCDDGANQDSDGCAADCTVEPYWVCAGVPSVCRCADFHGGLTCALCIVYVDVNPNIGMRDGARWGSAFATVQEGLDMAESLGPGCEVWVAQGTYSIYYSTPTDTLQLRTGVGLYGGFTGVENERAQRDWENYETILDGSQASAPSNRVYHVVTATDVSDVTMDGFTITNGKAVITSSDMSLRRGGGLYNDNSSPTVSNCKFSNNQADDQGAGMYNLVSSPIVDNCVFLGNRLFLGSSGSAYGHGAGMYNSGGSSPVIRNSLFYSNQSEDYGQGGGMYNRGTTTVINSVFYGNNARGGAGVYNFVGSLSMINSTFGRNTANEGCELYVESGTVNIENSIIWGACGADTIAGTPTITYSDVAGGYTGTGNISTDPLFVNSGGGDYRLQAGSPCIDTANDSAAPATDIDGSLRIDFAGVGNTGTLADMGAYEYQP